MRMTGTLRRYRHAVRRTEDYGNLTVRVGRPSALRSTARRAEVRGDEIRIPGAGGWRSRRRARSIAALVAGVLAVPFLVASDPAPAATLGVRWPIRSRSPCPTPSATRGSRCDRCSRPPQRRLPRRVELRPGGAHRRRRRLDGRQRRPPAHRELVPAVAERRETLPPRLGTPRGALGRGAHDHLGALERARGREARRPPAGCQPGSHRRGARTTATSGPGPATSRRTAGR